MPEIIGKTISALSIAMRACSYNAENAAAHRKKGSI